MANGLAENFPNRHFRVRVMNSSERDRKLSKGMEVGRGPRPPHPLRARKRVVYANETSHNVGREVGPGPLHSATHPVDPRVEAHLFAAVPCRREGDGSGVRGNPKDVEGWSHRARYV
jgi:hypothetical protein